MRRRTTTMTKPRIYTAAAFLWTTAAALWATIVAIQTTNGFVLPSSSANQHQHPQDWSRSCHHHHHHHLLQRLSDTISRHRGRHWRPPSLRMAVQQEQEQQQQQQQQLLSSEAERLREEASRMRLQAEQMDLDLTLKRIQSLEEKLNNPMWMEKHKGQKQEDDVREQLRRLNQKLYGSSDGKGSSSISSSAIPDRKMQTAPTTITATPSDEPFFRQVDESLGTPAKELPDSDTPATRTLSDEAESSAVSPLTTSAPPSSEVPSPPRATTSTFSSSSSNNNNRHIPPIAGFDADDLELYVPVAEDINKMVPNATLRERIDLFQQAPELQKHFQAKITKLLMAPLEDLQRLEELKAEYLDSNSSKERERLKSKIEKVEESLRNSGNPEDTDSDDFAAGGSGNFGYSDTIYCSPDLLPPLSEEELGERYQALQALPDILVAIYKQRTGAEYDDAVLLDVGKTENLKLAIQLDYYDLQLQLLEQARTIDPFTEDDRKDFAKAINSLPREVQKHFALRIGLDEVESITANTVLDYILDSDSPYSHPLLQVVDATDVMAESSSSEYNDIEFVDRSRFFEEFFPSVAGMEEEHPSSEDVDLFVKECLSKVKSFMVTSKPERVVGCYYVRGQNLLRDDPDVPGPTASERLVEEISQKLLDHPTLSSKLEFFYILDPSPPTDEDLELGAELTPILVVASKNEQLLYQPSSILTKTAVSLSGLASAAIFSVGCCVLNPSINDRLYVVGSGASESSTSNIDPQILLDLAPPLFLSLMGILMIHELGHRLAAAQHKFEIGLPNIIPSVTQGLAGTITPLKSPPPHNKALFDFAISGPLCGLAASIALLIVGLELTQSMSLDSMLPVLPVDFVRSSSLGGGLVEFFLGPTALLPDQGPNAFVQLHPFAIAGFIGCLINSLALLPLGHTDGGRISLAMFGRRGAFVTKLFTTLILTLAGIVGLDDNNILLTYVLFTLVWQRELETPIRNEVDEIDFSRGLVGIAGALLVGLTLIPML